MSDGLKMKYFVLKPHGADVYARASRAAMFVYAHEISADNTTFAHEVWGWVERERLLAQDPQEHACAEHPDTIALRECRIAYEAQLDAKHAKLVEVADALRVARAERDTLQRKCDELTRATYELEPKVDHRTPSYRDLMGERDAALENLSESECNTEARLSDYRMACAERDTALLNLAEHVQHSAARIAAQNAELAKYAHARARIAELEAHCAFYDLTVQQRNNAWGECAEQKTRIAEMEAEAQTVDFEFDKQTAQIARAVAELERRFASSVDAENRRLAALEALR